GLGINLGKLQSHPVPSKNAFYGFFATLEIQDLYQLEDLKRIMIRMTIEFEILGVYKKGETHG
ncbi:MAG: chorismate mutase, partial [Bacteroidota bacterium]